MSPAYARAILRYIARRKGGSGVAERERISAAIVGGLFSPHQQAFVTSRAKRRLARCGRRAGKTTAVASALILAAIAEPGAQAAYIALTRENAKHLLIPELERLRDAYSIPMEINRADLVVRVGEGGTVFLRGTDNERSVDKLRSFHFELIALDEIAFYGPHVFKLLDALEATMMDRDGAMVAISSPGYVCAGKFWEMDQPGAGWERYHWTALDNPHIPHAATWMADYRARRGWAPDNPTFLREIMGQWVDDARSLCFPFDPRINLYSELPPRHAWQHILGIDVGYSPDPSAFVVLAHAATHPDAFVVHSERVERWVPTRVWEHASMLGARFKVEAVAVDGTRGQVAELGQRFAQPVRAPRAKHDKAMHIAHIADDLAHGRLKLREADVGLMHEMRTVAWNAERTGPDPRAPNDLTDALQYAWCESSHYAARPQRVLSPKEKQDAEEDRMQAAAERSLRQDLDDEAFFEKLPGAF